MYHLIPNKYLIDDVKINLSLISKLSMLIWVFKVSVSRPLYFHDSNPSRLLINMLKYFSFGFDFAKIFKFF